ncbi:MAG TPA: hypothetical protein VFJ13_01005 [Paracoccaceae bacterium]|nr:hypothetical protein [Paracoccaceae bacterium]
MLKYFTGTHDHRMDDKGRVSLPTEFRRVLDAVGSPGALYLIPGLADPHGLACLSMPGYDKLIERFNTTEYADPADALRDEIRLIAHASQIQVDDAGRIVISRKLRDAFRLEKEVRFVGVASRFELWRPDLRDVREAERLGDAPDKPVGLSLHGLH